MYFYRKYFLLIFILILTIFSCCPHKNNSEFSPTLSAISERGTLLVGTTGDYRPLSYREPDTGRYWGFDLEVAETIAKRIGVPITYVPTSWPTLTKDVLDPMRFDLAIGGITITDTRKATMAMSEGYLFNGKTILCRKDDSKKYRNLSDINQAKVRVMVNPGGLNEKFAKTHLTKASLIIYPKNEEIPSQIANGKADIMITEITEAPYYVKHDTRLAAPLLDKPFTRGEIGVLMRSDQTDLLKLVNSVISEMKSDGSLAALHKKYGLLYGY